MEGVSDLNLSMFETTRGHSVHADIAESTSGIQTSTFFQQILRSYADKKRNVKI